MNKIFKVIYSKTKHCCVVVSELAKSHCKSTTGNTSREHRTGRQLTAMVLTALMGFTFGIAIPSTSWAWDGEDNKELGEHATVSGGKNNTANGTDSTITGGSMNNTGTYGTLVAGGNSNVAASLDGDGNYRQDGDNSYYDECSTVAGGYRNTALGDYSTLVGGSKGVVQGIYSTGIAGGSTGDRAYYALAMGYGSVVTNEGVTRNVKIAPNGSKRPEYSDVSTALGYQATANQPGTISFGHDAGDVSGYTVTWKEYGKDLFGNYKHTNADGTYYDYTQAPTITENHYDSSYYNRLVKIADGINSHDAVTMEQVTTADNTKANVAADNIGSKLQVVKKDGSGNPITDSKTGLPVMTAASDTEKTANESAWGQALGTGAVAENNDQLVTGNTVYQAMLNKANVAMDNITNDGKTVIRNLAKEAVKVVDGGHTYVTSKQDGDATAYAVNIKTGQVASGDGDLVTGGAVYDAIQNIKASGGSGQPVDISGKADISAGNVGQNFTKYSDNASTDEQKQQEKIDNENDWGQALGTGKIANSDATVTDADTNGSKQLVTGNTVYKEVRPTSNGKYITTTNTTAQNLTNLDTAIQKQATDLKVNPGWGIAIADETDSATKVTTKNVISLSRNLGRDADTKDKAVLKADEDKSALVIGGRVNQGDAKGGQTTEKDYGALGQDSVTVGGADNTASGDAAVVVGGLSNTASAQYSTVVGGSANDAIGNESSVFGGFNNDANGMHATISGGSYNRTYGEAASVFGGSMNNALGASSVAVGGLQSTVNGAFAVGIAGGSTNADYALAAGNGANVTVENGTAIGYQATTDEANTIAFGHDKGDVYYTSTWPQKATEKDGKYYDANNNEITEEQYEALRNADNTFNDYSKNPTITENTYDTASYNRLVKVADGVDDHDVVVMEQLKDYTKTDASNIGNNIKVYKTDEQGNVLEDTDATKTAQNTNKDAWGKALGADTFTTGTSDKATNASTSDQLVTGKTLYNYDAPVAESGKTLSYVSANNTTGQNLSALDAQVAVNTKTLKDKTHNIKYYSVNDELPLKVDNYSNEGNDGAKGMGSIAAGFNTRADGIASTVVGSYSGVLNQNSGGLDPRGATALSYGTFNFNQNTDTTKTYSGVANSIIGQANATTDSNAAIIYGAGNTVTNSYRKIDDTNASEIIQAALSKDVKKLSEALQKAVPNSGAQVMVMGGGNTVDKAYMTQVTGVGNKVTGADSTYAEDTSTQYNFVDGFQNELTNGKHDYIIGSNNKVSGDNVDTNQSNIIFGDNHKLTNQKNNVIIGSSDTADDETTASDIVAIGHNAKVSVEGGVAIGSGSVVAASTEKVSGYDPTTKTQSTDKTSSTWNATTGAVSIGTADGTVTRQLNGVAAGTNDTDAVNVAQLKKLEGMKANIDASNIGSNITVAPIYQKDKDGHDIIGQDGQKVIDQKATEDAEKAARTANENAWGTAIGTGEVAKDNGQLVTGKTVYEYNKPIAKDGKDLNYVSEKNTTGQNLGALDTQVKKNADDITNINKSISTLDQNAVKYDDSNKSKVTLGGENGTTITNVKDGTLSDSSTDAVNGKQLYSEQNARQDADTAINNKIGSLDANGNYIQKDASVSNNLSTLDTQVKANADAISKETSDREAADAAINNKIGSLDANGNYIQKDASVSSNLSTLDTQVKKNADAIKKNSESIQNITNNVKNLSDNAVQYDKDSNKSKVTLAGKDGTTITNVKDGALSDSSTDAVNGKQLYNEQQAREAADNAITKKVTSNTDEITKIKNGAFTDASKTAIHNIAKDAVEVVNGKNTTVTTVEGTDKTPTTYAVNVEGTGKVASGDTGLISGDTLYKEVHVDKDGSYIKSSQSVGQNLSALDTGLKTTSDLIHTNDKGDTIQIGGNSTATKIDVSGKDANGNTTGRVITGVVSDASDPNSAANVGYVNGLTAANTQQIYRDMNNAYSRLDTNINRAAAGSNALAALHPLDFDPADKASFAVGYGHYHNANAAAVGAFYQPNANTMVNMGISLGNGDPGFNAGVSFKIGKGSTYNGVSKAEMAQTIHDQAAEISTIKANDAAKDKRIDALEKENQEMKKQIQEILARLNG